MVTPHLGIPTSEIYYGRNACRWPNVVVGTDLNASNQTVHSLRELS